MLCNFFFKNKKFRGTWAGFIFKVPFLEIYHGGRGEPPTNLLVRSGGANTHQLKIEGADENWDSNWGSSLEMFGHSTWPQMAWGSGSRMVQGGVDPPTTTSHLGFTRLENKPQMKATKRKKARGTHNRVLTDTSDFPIIVIPPRLLNLATLRE